jgi:hypothetical protein
MARRARAVPKQIKIRVDVEFDHSNLRRELDTVISYSTEATAVAMQHFRVAHLEGFFANPMDGEAHP